MASKPDKVTVAQDFSFEDDAELDRKVSEFRTTHEAEHGQRLAMDAKRSLGPGKVRVTFRVVADAGKGKGKGKR